MRPLATSGDVQKRSMSIFQKFKDFFYHAPDLKQSQSMQPATTFRAKAPATLTQGEVILSFFTCMRTEQPSSFRNSL